MPDTTVATARYGTIITAAGAAKIAAGILNGTKVNITHAAVGDGGGSYYMPTTAQTALVRECWRGEIAYARISEDADNIIDVKFIVPADVGGFTIREAALIDADGDTIAICNTPDAEKVPILDGVSFPLTMVMHIIVEDASVVSFSINPALDTVSREEMEQALAAYADGVGSAVLVDVTVPAAGWGEITETPDGLGNYKYSIDVVVPDALDAHFPSMALAISSLSIASAAGLCPTIEALDGILRFWAQKIPTADITGQVMLRSENLLYTGSSGGVVPDDGYLTGGDIASDDEVSDMVENVFGDSSSDGDSSGDEGPTEEDAPDGYEVATDEEVSDMITDIFG